ncbi:MAG TPA: hypothetical protein VEQ58_07540, partial [Polyangiaceae bacterium]|nr:hypothetical protein [Polyangiaceae bacterium]
MSAAVKLPNPPNVAALLLSVGLHAAFLLLPLLGALHSAAAPSRPELPNSVAMLGNSIEVEAPTPELAATPAAPTPSPPESEPPVDVKSLPVEPAPVVVATPSREHEAAAAAAPATPAPPRPRLRPRRPVPPAAAAAPEAPRGSEASTSGAPAAGTFGQEGLAPGVRRLGYAFTRAIPASTPADSAWRELPTGHVGTIRIELEVDDNNRLGSMKRWQARPGEPAPPAALERLVERTLILLRAGQFALSGSNQAGSERLVIDVQLRDEAADDDPVSEVVQKKFEGATPTHPGKAYFRYG